MIAAQDFVEAARELGFGFYAGVPCSFLKPFINYVIDDPDLVYVSSANEGDAVATASGAGLAGQRSVAMMQNSGLGNAVSPLTSLNWVFRIPVLLIVTWRGMPGLTDEPQHELMGKITQTLLETIDVPWEIFPESPDQIGAALSRAVRHMDQSGTPYALVMKKGTVASHSLQGTAALRTRNDNHLMAEAEPAARITRSQALAKIQQASDELSCLIASTGYNGRELFALDDRPNQLYMVGSMGCASSLGLGLAMSRPDRRVIIIDGDGAALMRMGNLATLGTYGGDNLVHILLDNEVHDSTGGQATVSAGVDFAAIAAACGYARCYAGNDPKLLATAMEDGQGPVFVHMKIQPGSAADLPRPALKPCQIKKRLMQHLGVATQWSSINA